MVTATVIVAVIGLCVSLIDKFGEWFGDKPDPDLWDQWSTNQKKDFIRSIMDECFTQTELQKQLPDQYPLKIADYFWTFVSQTTGDSWEKWRGKFFADFVAPIQGTYQTKYKRRFFDEPILWGSPAVKLGMTMDETKEFQHQVNYEITPLKVSNKAGIAGVGKWLIIGVIVTFIVKVFTKKK